MGNRLARAIAHTITTNVTEEVLERISVKLVYETVQESLVELGQGTSQELAVQHIQNTTGHINGYDWKAVGLNAGISAIAGGVGGATGFGLGRKLPTTNGGLTGARNGATTGAGAGLAGATAAYLATGAFTGQWDFDPRSFTGGAASGAGPSAIHGYRGHTDNAGPMNYTGNTTRAGNPSPTNNTETNTGNGNGAGSGTAGTTNDTDTTDASASSTADPAESVQNSSSTSHTSQPAEQAATVPAGLGTDAATEPSIAAGPTAESIQSPTVTPQIGTASAETTTNPVAGDSPTHPANETTGSGSPSGTTTEPDNGAPTSPGVTAESSVTSDVGDSAPTTTSGAMPATGVDSTPVQADTPSSAEPSTPTATTAIKQSSTPQVGAPPAATVAGSTQTNSPATPTPSGGSAPEARIRRRPSRPGVTPDTTPNPIPASTVDSASRGGRVPEPLAGANTTPIDVPLQAQATEIESPTSSSDPAIIDDTENRVPPTPPTTTPRSEPATTPEPTAPPGARVEPADIHVPAHGRIDDDGAGRAEQPNPDDHRTHRAERNQLDDNVAGDRRTPEPGTTPSQPARPESGGLPDPARADTRIEPSLHSIRFDLSEQTLRRVESLARERDQLMDTMRTESALAYDDPRIQQAAVKTAAAAALAGADYLTAIGAELVTERVALLRSEPTRILLLANGDIPDRSRMQQLLTKALTSSPELSAALARPDTRVEFLRVLLADSAAHIRVLRTETAADVAAWIEAGPLSSADPDASHADAVENLVSQRDALNHERHLQRIKRDERAERFGIDDPAQALSASNIETTIRRLSDSIVGREYVGARVDLDDYTVAEEVSEETLIDRRKEIAKLQAAAWRVVKLDWDWSAYSRRIFESTGETNDTAISPSVLTELDALALARVEATVAVEPYRVMRDDITARLAEDNIGPLGRQHLTELLAEATHRVELAENAIGRVLDQMSLLRGAGRSEVLEQGGRMLTERVGLVPGETPRLIVFAAREASDTPLHELDTALESALLRSPAAAIAFRTPATSIEFKRVLADDNGGWRLADVPSPQRLIAEPQRTRLAQHMPATIVGWLDATGNHRFVDETKPWTTGHSREPEWFGDGKERDPTKEPPKGITGWAMDPLQTSVLGNFETLPPGHVFTELTPALPGAPDHFEVPMDVYSSPIDGLLYNAARLVLETVGVFAGMRLRRDPLNPARLMVTFKWHRQLSWFARRTNPDYRPPIDVQPRIHQWDAAEHATVLDPPSIPLQERERAEQQAWARVQEWADTEYRRFRAGDHDIDRIVANLAARDEDYRIRHADKVIDKVQATIARLNPDFGRANDETLAKLTDWVAEQLHEDFREQAPDIVDAIVHRETSIAGTVADRLAGSTFSHSEITQIKNYLMRDLHLAIDRRTGDPVRQRMDAVADIAEAWIRLAYGVPVDEDILLLRNSSAGSRYLAENPDALWREADRHAIGQGFDWNNHRPPAAPWRIDIKYAPQPLEAPSSPLPLSRRATAPDPTPAIPSEPGARPTASISGLLARAEAAEAEQRRAAARISEIAAAVAGPVTPGPSPRTLGRSVIDHIDAELTRPEPEPNTVPTGPDDMVRSVWERLARDREHERLAGVRADVEQQLTRYLDARAAERELRRQLHDVAAGEALRAAGARVLADRIGIIDGDVPRALVLSTNSATEPLVDDQGWRGLTDADTEITFKRVVLDDAGRPHLVDWQVPREDGRYRTANERLDVIEGSARRRIDEIALTATSSVRQFVVDPAFAERIEEARQQAIAQLAAARQSAVSEMAEGPDVRPVQAGAHLTAELSDVVHEFTATVAQEQQAHEISRAPDATWFYGTPRPHTTSPQVAATITDQTAQAARAIRRAKSAADALTGIHSALDNGATATGPRVTRDRIDQHIETAIAAAREAVGRDGAPQADQIALYQEIRALNSLKRAAAKHLSTYLWARAEAQRLSDAATELAIADVLAAAGVTQAVQGIGVLPGAPGRILVTFEGADPHLSALSAKDHRQRLARGEQLLFQRVFVDEHGQVHVVDAELCGGTRDDGLDTPVRGPNSGGSPSITHTAVAVTPTAPAVITGPHYDIIRGPTNDDAAFELRIRLRLELDPSESGELAQSIVDAAQSIVFGPGKWYSPLTGEPYQFTLDPVDSPTAHLRLGLPAETTDIGDAARLLAVALRDHLGLPPTSSMSNGLTVDEGDVEALTREARLGGLRLAVPDAHYAFMTTRGRETLAPLESRSLQAALEQAARVPEGGYVRGFDPRTSAVADLINPGGDTAPGRGGNCWAVVASALLTFLGDPQVAPPVRGDRAAGTAATMADWLRAGLMSWGNREIDPSSFEMLQRQVAELGPGSAAPVFVGWQDTDQDGNLEYRADGTPVLIGHALLVVYPLDAPHPVWWCPQEQATWDRPPSKYVENARILTAIPLLPDGTAALEYTDPNAGGSPAVHYPSSAAHRPRVGLPVRVRLDSDVGTADPGGPTGHAGRNSPIHSELPNRSDHQPSELGEESLDRPIHRGDENWGTTTRAPAVPTAHADTPATDVQRNNAGPLPDPASVPVRGQRTGPGIPADDRQAGLGIQPDVASRHSSSGLDSGAASPDGRLAGDGRTGDLDFGDQYAPAEDTADRHDLAPGASPLPDIAGTREFGPGRIAPLETAAYQEAVERTAGGRAGFDPRSDPVPINDGGMSVPGRFTNCVECVMAGLSSFFGRPTVAFPREIQLRSDGTQGYTSGESPQRVAQWVGAELLHFDPALDVTEHYQQLHDLITELGPGSAAFVATRWQRIDGAGRRAFRSDGSRVLKGGHASTVVFPLEADGPVWWDPQSGATDDHPSAKFLSDAGQLRVIVLRPDGSIYRAETDPNRGRSRDLPVDSTWPRPEMAARPGGVRLDRLTGTDGPGTRGRGVHEPTDAGAGQPDSADPPVSELVGASGGRELPRIDEIGYAADRGADLPAPRPVASDTAATRSGRAGIPDPGRVPGVTEGTGDGVLDADRPAHRSSPTDMRGIGTRGSVDTHAEPQREQLADPRDSRVLSPLVAEAHAQYGSDTEAARLAAHLGTDVLAPTARAWTDEHGRVYTSGFEIDSTGNRRPRIPPDGQWITHHPDGTTTRTTTDGFAPRTPATDRSSLDPNSARERGWRDRFRSRPGSAQDASTETATTDPHQPSPAATPEHPSRESSTSQSVAEPTNATQQPPADVPFTLSAAPTVAESAAVDYVAPDLSAMPPLRDFVEGSSDDELMSILSAMNGRYGPFDVRIDEAEYHDVANLPTMEARFDVKATVHDPESGNIGRIEYFIYLNDDGELVLFHQLIKLNDSARGKGFAGHYTLAMNAYYRRSDLDVVEIKAGLSEGGYVWARRDFLFDPSPSKLKSSIQNILKRIRSVYPRCSPAEQVVLDEMAKRLSTRTGNIDHYPKPREIADLAGDDGTLGKRILRGSEWWGRIELNHGL
ncbi:toxin glutamine deamidase domain-containing protein [Nocardia sp. GTS18]|uniref:toxin glutamine deamidase domain-containing protein n=1 Tax=Nocardia sp. GTS18 TaxID=1778064 RepID=UPI001C681B22|nr:toxin glutamine deamidase domain-containing protein [Nocardia sp. GTS18]